jgi:hypothetical protein
MPDPQSMVVAVELALPFGLGAELHAIQYFIPPSLILYFRFLTFWFHINENHIFGLLDPKNMSEAIGIALLSGL